MAGSIPPLVSSSPPPLCAFDDDDDEEEEEDDEFGMYTVAEEVDYNDRNTIDCISFKEKDGEKQTGGKCGGEQDSTSQDSATDSGLCPDSEGVSPTPHSDDERTVRQCERQCQQPGGLLVVTINGDSEPKECLNTSSVSINSASCVDLQNGHANVEEHCITTESDDDFGNFEFAPTPSLQLDEQGLGSSEVLELNLRQSESAESNGLVSPPEVNFGEKQINGDFHDYPGQTVGVIESDEISRVDVIESNSDIKDNFYFEFPSQQQDFSDGHDTLKEDIVNNENSVCESEHQDNIHFEIKDNEFEEFTDFKADFCNNANLSEIEQTDKISEYSKPTVEQEYLGEAAESLQLPQQDESDDEFSNFADFSSSDCAFVSAQSSNSLENVCHIPVKACDDNELRTDSEFQDWVSVFPSEESEPDARAEASLLREDDVVWARLFPLESSPALSYQWAESLANRRLLSALNIDSRNILFMPWSNSSVPRFAANLSCGPLEPVKATEPLQPAPQPTPAPQPPSSLQESVPDAHFDWVSSGLTNPLDYPKPVLNQLKTLSVEAESIMASLPDLSFMRKTYIDFPINEG